MGRCGLGPYTPRRPHRSGPGIRECPPQTRMAFLISYLNDIPQDYHRLILWITEKTGLPDNLLHIHSGLIIFLAARLVTRCPYRSFVPFLCVVLAEGANELLDYPAYGWRPTDTYHDIANTLFWPLMISLCERLQPVSRRR